MDDFSLYNFKSPNDYMLLFDETIKTMLKGGASHEHVLKVLYYILLYNGANPVREDLEEEILTHHAILLETGGYKNKRNVQQEVENLIQFRGNGTVTLSDFYTDLKLNDKEEKHACRVAINRIVARGVLEKLDSGRTGTYRLIRQEVERTKFVKGEDGGRDFTIKLPFDLNSLCRIHPKSIIIFAGSKSAGKTATMLHIALSNQNNIPVDYFNSDMGDEEFTERMCNMGCVCAEDIKFNIYNRASHFHDLIGPDRKIYIIDFLEVHDEFWKIGEQIKKIWDKLDQGVAVIAMQMKQGAKLARGGDFTKEKARLYVGMDYDEREKCTRLTIEDAKIPKEPYKEHGVRGWWSNVKIIGGGKKFQVMKDWNGYEIEQRKNAFQGKF